MILCGHAQNPLLLACASYSKVFLIPVLLCTLQVSACPQISPALRTRVRAQFTGLCKGDPEQPTEEEIVMFAFDPNAKPPASRPSTPLSSPRDYRKEVTSHAPGCGDADDKGGSSDEDSEVMLSSDESADGTY